MKFYFSLSLLIILGFLPFFAFGQTPEAINYQAVARDNTGSLITNQNVDVRFSILEASNSVYEETHSVSTNDYGLFSLVIGEGIVINGDFSTIDWENGTHQLKVEIDTGSGFVNMGTSKFVSVPYSLLAQKAEKVDMGLADLTDVGSTAPQSGEVLKWNGTAWIPDSDDGVAYSAGSGIAISGGNVIENTEPDQVVSLSGSGATSVTGTYPNFSISSTDDNTTYSAGSGISISGANVIQNTEPDQVVSINGSGATNVTGTYPNFNISSTDANTTYSAGAGLNLSGTTFSNTGDLDDSDDITTSTSAGGDLNGTYPNPSVTALNGNAVSSSAPSSNQVLKWNGSAWAPANDNAGSSVWSTNAAGATYFNGNDVGIGTSSPAGRLEISHNSSLSDPHIFLHENGNDYSRLRFDNNNGSNYWTIAAYIASNHRNDRLNFWNGVGGDVMTITGDGEVGIGVGISPKVPFHVGNQRRVLFGIDTLGNGDKLMFLPDLHAFRVGTVATGAASTYWNRDSIGLYSFASGYNTRAQGFGATAMGRDTEATNSYAFASGFFSNADGQYSTAMGFNTDAFALGSTAMGYSTDAEQNYSTAMGYFAEAQAIYSVSIGNATRAQSYSSMAVGRYNIGGGSATSWITSDPIFEIGIGTGPSTRANAVTVRKNGNVGIGTTVPLDRLHVNGRVRLQTVEYIEDGGTSEIAVRGDLRPSSDNIYDIGTSSLRWDDVYATNGTINTSDRRDKENIQDLNYGLNEILQLRPVRFTWKKRPQQGEKLGLIAQEIQPVIGEVVKTYDYDATEEDETVLVKKDLDRLGVYYSDLIPVLIKGMQEQQEMIEELKNQVEAQQKEIEELKKD